MFLKNQCLNSILFIGVVFNSVFVLGQDWKGKYDERLESNLGFSYEKLLKVSQRKDAYNFIAIGYFINANTLMYKKSKDVKYLNYNKNILLKIIENIDSEKKFLIEWKWGQLNKSLDKVEYIDNIVLEGYFYRYLGEYIEVLKREDLFTDEIEFFLDLLGEGFKRWTVRSIERYGDLYSLLFHIRIHIASNWGVVALYLYSFTNDKLYYDYIDILNKQLKKNLELKLMGDELCYVWQSNYKEKFTKLLQTKNIGNPVVQDVGHANHVVTYMISSYELGFNFWNEKDLIYLSNTLYNLIWDKNFIKFSDNVDGSHSTDKEFQNQGWKQADGWIKLIKYNSSLKAIYQEYYKYNSAEINTSSMALQYYVNLL
ncbi:hypothetical protein [Myroides odoratimimus]|uniref:hypothetical protein n=1 Tax=Myroides odoratimimus TaxID=76832 RepID=UPI002DBB145B|nr:hypothetical protein [Myroides odoratimimus]MEC4028770.1 hypothetical protein [Myroides odoratimimus]